MRPTPAIRFFFIWMLAWSLAAAGTAQAAGVVTCPGGVLTQSAGEIGADLEVTGPCEVPGGTYQFRHVNIWDGGVLRFTDAEIEFWASGIVVENGGTLEAGSPTAPIGTAGGELTIHLYGADRGAGGAGVPCKSDERCGVPVEIWESNVVDGQPVPPADARKISELGSGAPAPAVDDYFYAYSPLPYDDGDENAYFGYKVLAVSYGGSLELFGEKGARYCSDGSLECPDELPASTSGTSWGRLDGSVEPGATEIVVDRPVDWEAGDEIVITTTDYLPGHSEQRTIVSTAPGSDGTTITLAEPLDYPHNGERYSLDVVPDRLGLDPELHEKGAELRAAVGLLTRSIRIVSAGDELGEPFPDGPGEYLGGHAVFRQGFRRLNIQGVEFYQMGQGGKLGHYPVHFHMARRTAPGTFVKDSSIHDSMTRWVVLHATHDVTLARNVGYLSIGHGFYLEDGTEIGNRLLSNLGVFARAAVDNAQNPRRVPGILAAPDLRDPPQERVPYRSDYAHPTVFWVMNGWNDFRNNMAAGASACGVCYWLLPGAHSGASRNQRWESYASMETSRGRTGMTPLKSFVGNTCTTAMTSFQTVGATATCHGVGDPGDGSPFLDPIENPRAPASDSPEAADYYPVVDPGGGRFATRCTESDCSDVPRCGAGNEECMITALEGYTSSFNWAEFNYAAIWLRPQWYHVTDSVISDVQGAGLTFVTGGGYTASDRVPGHWALVDHSVFIGESQPENAFALDGGPFNPESGLECAGRDVDGRAVLPGNYCLAHDEGVPFPVSNFGMSQRLFNIYDGPAYQSSNAYLDIRRRPIDDCSPSDVPGRCTAEGWTDDQDLVRTDSRWMAGHVTGLPKSSSGECYMPNAAIGWKQPNGFYYPPAFRSDNLFFHDVDIRHFLIHPLFEPGGFETDLDRVSEEYCVYNDQLFADFTDIDRQTVLNDDDGSLTGYAGTISINVDPFFHVPVQDIECASDETATVSPYEYVTTVVYPRCATEGECALPPPLPSAPPEEHHVGLWDRACTNQSCFGVPLYSQQLTDADQDQPPRSIRMMGQSIGQRSNLTVEDGVYYVDTTVGEEAQKAEACSGPGNCSISVFRPGETYYLFTLFAEPSTRQTYQIYVGEGFDLGDLFMTQADIGSLPIQFSDPRPIPPSWSVEHDAETGILEVTMDLSAQAGAWDRDAIGEELCRPATYCHWDSSRSQCVDAQGSDEVCGFAVRDVECPLGGCFGFGFTLPETFSTDPGLDPRPEAECFPRNDDWDVSFDLVGEAIAGSCPEQPAPFPDFCRRLKQAPTSLSFARDRSHVLEGDTGTITVSRSGGTDGSVSVDLATRSGSATAGEDYESTTSRLSWEPEDPSERTAAVTTIEDTIVEGTEELHVELSNPTGGATLGPRPQTTVAILDDEGDTSPCVEDATTLCLGADGRFRVTMTWTSPSADSSGSPSGPFTALALPVRRDSGLFYFFEVNNVEALVKVLDGCGVDGLESFWASIATATHLGYTVTITDTRTGVVREYGHELGEPTLPVFDTNAFPVCDL